MTLIIIFRIVYEAYFRFPHFKIIKAGMRKWLQKNSEELVSYQIVLKMKKPSSELTLEDLWIDKKKYRFCLSRDNIKFIGGFREKEILSIIIISELFNDNLTETVDISKKGKLVLGYSFRNKKKYVSINKFCEIDKIRLSSGL